MSTAPIATPAPVGAPMPNTSGATGPRWVKVVAIAALPCSLIPFLGLGLSAVGLGAGLFHRHRSAIVMSGIAFVIALLVTIAVASTPTPASTGSPAAPAPAPAVQAPAPVAAPPVEPAPAPAPVPAAPVVPAGPASSFDEGTFVVGTDITAGTYKTAGPADGGIGMCYWERLRDTSGEFDAIIANGLQQGPATVTVSPSDGAFQTQGCSTWTKVR